MGLFDSIRDRFRPQDDNYYDEEYDEYYDEPAGPRGLRSLDPETSGVLGNTRRPEAESVSVYTRSGRPVGDNGGSGRDVYGSPSPAGGRRDGGYATREYAPCEYAGRDAAMSDYAQDETTPVGSREGVLGNSTGGKTPADIGLKPIPRTSTSGQLPPYVLKPVSYDDVQMVVRRVRTGQPVVLVFKSTNIDTAKRILDFSFGLACGIAGQVDELGDRVFAVMPQGIELGQADIDKLVADGTIER